MVVYDHVCIGFCLDEAMLSHSRLDDYIASIFHNKAVPETPGGRRSRQYSDHIGKTLPVAISQLFRTFPYISEHF